MVPNCPGLFGPKLRLTNEGQTTYKMFRLGLDAKIKYNTIDKVYTQNLVFKCFRIMRYI